MNKYIKTVLIAGVIILIALFVVYKAKASNIITQGSLIWQLSQQANVSFGSSNDVVIYKVKDDGHDCYVAITPDNSNPKLGGHSISLSCI